MPGLLWEWDSASQTTWQRLLGTCRAGLQQGWSYGEALSDMGLTVQRLIVRDTEHRPLACAQIVFRRFLGLWRAGFLLRGPVWLDPAASAGLERVLPDGIRTQLGRAPLIWSPETVAGAARRPVMTGYSTAWLDLAQRPAVLRAQMAADWRNSLARAGRHHLRIDDGCRPRAIAWLLDHNELYRRQVGYHGPSRAFLGRLAARAAASGELLALVAYAGDEPVAGMLIIRHGAAATYEVGYASPRGRSHCASHALLWHAMQALPRMQVRWLDLGGLATDRAPGIARFKLGMGGQVCTLPGTFLLSSFGIN